LNKELLDLVNDNYQDFLSLGSTLSTGEEKVEEVRVGLLGFQRDLLSIKGKVDARRNEVAQLLEEKRGLKQDIRVGRALLEIAERLDYLEERLLIVPRAKGGLGRVQKEVDLDDGYESEDLTEDSQEDQSDNDSESKNKHQRLQRLVERCMVIRVLLDRHPQTAAFIRDQDERLREVQATLRLDIEATLKQEADLGADSSTISNLVQMRLGLEARI
jgi:conserved oligomeric Golgi complex subunit 2